LSQNVKAGYPFRTSLSSKIKREEQPSGRRPSCSTPRRSPAGVSPTSEPRKGPGEKRAQKKRGGTEVKRGKEKEGKPEWGRRGRGEGSAG